MNGKNQKKKIKLFYANIFFVFYDLYVNTKKPQKILRLFCTYFFLAYLSSKEIDTS